MEVLISGSTGLIGSALAKSLEADGHTVGRMVRKPTESEQEVHWNPATGHLDHKALARWPHIVHLAGENIAGGRWNKARKRRIRDSRVVGTKMLCDALAEQQPAPRTLVCASAIGFYGPRGDELVNEESAPGKGFLAEICQDWEAAVKPARDVGIRTVQLRIGIVLSRHGSALKKMLPAFKLGGGGKLGSGRQWMSWIALSDMVRIIRGALDHQTMSGIYNAVAPNPVTNAEFTRTLGRVLRRPTIFPVPGFVLRFMLGREMANELLLTGTRVAPTALLEAGFEFQHPQLESALRAALEDKR